MTTPTRSEQAAIGSNGKGPSPTTSVMATGLSIWRGTITTEYLNELTPWSKAYKVYTQMADDAVIGAMLNALKSPLLAAGFDVELGGTSDADKQAAEFLGNTIYSMSGQTWRDHVQDALSFLDYGWAISEKVLEKRSDGLLHIASLIPVGQDTLYEWGKLDNLGRVTSFKQQTNLDGKAYMAELPMAKLLHFTLQPRKRDPQGRSLLRLLYRPWYFKSNLEVIEAIGAERDVGNVPVFSIGEQGISTSQLTDLKTAAENFRMDEAAYLILPNGVTVQGYGGGSKVYNIRQMIESWSHVIRQTFFADFISLGGESVGTQALSRESQTFFFKALVFIQKVLLEGWNTQLIPYLFQWNEGKFDGITKNKSTGEPSYPKLAWNNPGRMDLINLATYISNLVNVRVMTPNRELEQHMRVVADLPPLAPDEEAISEQVEVVDEQSNDKPGGGVSGDKQVDGGAKGQDEKAKKGGDGEGDHGEHAEHTESRTYLHLFRSERFYHVTLLSNVPNIMSAGLEIRLSAGHDTPAVFLASSLGSTRGFLYVLADNALGSKPVGSTVDMAVIEATVPPSSLVRNPDYDGERYDPPMMSLSTIPPQFLRVLSTHRFIKDKYGVSPIARGEHAEPSDLDLHHIQNDWRVEILYGGKVRHFIVQTPSDMPVDHQKGYAIDQVVLQLVNQGLVEASSNLHPDRKDTFQVVGTFLIGPSVSRNTEFAEPDPNDDPHAFSVYSAIKAAVLDHGQLSSDELIAIVKSEHPNEPLSWRAWMHYARQVMRQTLTDKVAWEGLPPKEFD